MNLRPGWPAAGATASRRPLSKAIGEAPPARGSRRLCTHMSSQYDGEVSCKLRSATVPGGRTPEPGGWNRIHFVVEDIASEVQRLKGADVNCRNEIVTVPGSEQIRLEGASGNQSSSSSQRPHGSSDSGEPYSHTEQAHPTIANSRRPRKSKRAVGS
jgi:hypothetical protein